MTTPVLTARQKRRLPWILAVGIFMQMLDATILNTALPVMAKDLQVSPLNMQMVVISYALTLALIMPLSGWLADRFGTRTIFLTSIVLFSAGSLFCALSSSLEELVFFRVVQGTGGAMMIPVGRLALMRSFDKSEWLDAMSFAVTPALIGPLIGPLLGGYLAQWASWHWIFLINLPIGALGLWFGMRYFPNFTKPGGRMDISGYALFTLSALLLTLGLDWAGQGGSGALFSLLIATGLLMLWGYVRHAEKRRDALFPLELLAVRTFRVGLAGNLFSRIGISSIPLLLPLLLQVAFGRTPEIAGWMLAPMALSGIAAKPLIVPLIHRFGYRRVLTVNTTLVGLCVMSLALPSADTPLLLFLPLLLVVGLVNSIQFSAMNTIALADLHESQTGSGNSLMSVNQQLAISFGLAAGASLLRFTHQQEWLTHGDTHLAFRCTFIALGAITLASTLIFKRLHHGDGDNLAQRI
ncbi:MAG: multidrug transporter subunit MdtD [Neisseria sp.]|nr:multidrug transporter subunit MdtD [Neisseria sp.]